MPRSATSAPPMAASRSARTSARSIASSRPDRPAEGPERATETKAPPPRRPAWEWGFVVCILGTSVSRHRAVDAIRPGSDPAGEIAHLPEAGVAEEGDRLGAARADVAVRHDLA